MCPGKTGMAELHGTAGSIIRLSLGENTHTASVNPIVSPICGFKREMKMVKEREKLTSVFFILRGMMVLAY